MHLSPEALHQRTLEIFQGILLASSRARPLVVAVEDLHWMDRASAGYMSALVEALVEAPVLLLTTHRTGHRLPWSDRSHVTELKLQPLARPDARRVLDEALERSQRGAQLSAATTEAMLDRADGNPLFIEELARATGPSPAAGAPVPESIEAVLLARVDRLPEECKGVLQAASVLGRDVPVWLLEAITPAVAASKEHLRELQRLEYLHDHSDGARDRYRFKHALTQEVAYASLLPEHRRALHARIVGAMETQHAGRLAEQTEALAHHAVRGQLWRKAADYLRQTGSRAAARYANHEAVTCFEGALEALEHLPGGDVAINTLPESRSTLEQAFGIRLELRQVLIQLGEVRQTLEHLREAEVLAERLNDDGRRGRVCAAVTNAHSNLGELDEALASGTRALEIAGRLGDLRLRILTTSYLEQVHYYRGEYERVVELATDNLATLPADWVHEYFGGSNPPSVMDRVWLVVSFAQLGRFVEAAGHEAEAIRLADSTHHAHTICQAHLAAVTFQLLKGDWAKARSLVERWIAVARTGNVFIHLPLAVASSAWALAQLGEASEALNRLQEGEQLLVRREVTGPGRPGWVDRLLGRTCLLLGRLDDARRLGDAAAECRFAADALLLLGDIATHPDRFDAERGEAHYRQALALAEPRGMRPLVAHCHLGLGKLYRRIGKRELAREHLTTATTLYREMDMPFWLAKAEVEIDAAVVPG
jgi:tetratricopeptide (TPR) repeat protein